MLTLTSKNTTILLALLVVSTAGSNALAQRSRGSETDLLRREEVHQEIGLSEEQTKKLQELQAKSTTSRDDFEKYRKDLEAAETDEDKKKIRDAFSAQVIKSRTLFQDTALSVLDDSQKGKLRGLYLRNAGPRGLTNEAVAEDYGLTDEQKTKLEELSGEQRAAARQLDSETSDEDRAKFEADWREKHLAVLTPEQKARFEKELALAPDGNSEERSVASASDNTPPATTGRTGVAPMSNEPPPGEDVTASFGAATGERQRIKEFRFNFRFAPWDQVLQMFADGTGLTLDLGQVPPGTFSHLDDNAYTAKQALDIINGYLLRKGFGMFEKEGFLIVINLDGGIPPSLLRDVSVEELLQLDPVVVGNNELVNVTIEIEDMDTAKAAQEIEALIGPWGSMIALTESRLLIITDIGSNLRRIHGLLTRAMAKAKPNAVFFKPYFLEHMDAEEAQLQVMTQFGMRQNVENVSQAAEERSRMRARTQASSRQQQPAPTSTSDEPEIQIAPDLRMNSLLVTGTTKQHDLVETILTALDVNETPWGDPLVRGRKGIYLEVYQLHSSDASEVAKTLSAMNMPGVNVVNEDGRHGRLHIMANERQHAEVAVLIRQLDGAGSSGSVAVIQLHSMDPLSAAATLRSLFYADGDDAPTIESDLYGRRLIVRGTVEHIAQIKQVLADLGETGGPRVREGGTVRRVPLQGRDPQKFLRILKQEWESKEASRLNILIPEEDGPVKSRQTSEGELETDQPPPERPATTDEPRVSKTSAAEPATSPSLRGTITFGQSARSTGVISQRASSLSSSTSGKWGQWKRPKRSLTQTYSIRTRTDTPDESSVATNQASTSEAGASAEDKSPESATGSVDSETTDKSAKAAGEATAANDEADAEAPGEADAEAPGEGSNDADTAKSDDSKADDSNRGTADAADINSLFRDLEVIVLGDELIISSGNEQELDRLEDLLDMLQQTLPFKQEFTQFFLKSADAVEASDMLAQFFPSSSVASTSAATGGSMLGSLSSSLGSMGSSLMDATGLSGLGTSSNALKIIPDLRTNSLFIAGPPMMIKDAISVLKVLDSDDGPESLKDMQARSIPVLYADVGDVKRMLDDLFKTYLEAQNQGRNQQQQNPLAAMFGGATRGGNNPAAQVRMHLAVDEQNSMILVNSSQQLYDEVEQVVNGLDKAAQNANKLIRIIQLKNADASMIQSSLTSLLPRVSISSSRTGSPSSSSSRENGGGTPSSSNSQQDAFNKMIQDRIRQRMEGGGGGGSLRPGGGGTGGRGSGGGRGTGGGFGGRGGFGGGR